MHMQELYGDARKRSALFAESAAQLQLEAVAGSAAAGGAAASAPQPQPRPAPPAGDALAARLAPEQDGAAELQHAAGQRAHAQANGVGLQPASAAQPPQPPGNAAARVRGPALHAGRGQRGLSAAGGSAAGGPAEDPARPRSAVAVVARRHAASAAQPGSELALAEPIRQPSAGAALGRAAAQLQLPPPPLARRLAVQLAPDALALRDTCAARMLEAVNPAAGAAGSMRSQLVCSCGAERLWDVMLHDRVVMLCGGANFAAAAMQGGTLEVSCCSLCSRAACRVPCAHLVCLYGVHVHGVTRPLWQVYTTAGRLLLPPLHLGACAAFMATDGAWRLLVVGTDGCLRLWNLQELLLEVEASVLPLLNKPGARAEGALVPVRLLVSHTCLPCTVMC